MTKINKYKSKVGYFISESQRKHTSRLSFIYGSKKLVAVVTVLVIASIIGSGAIIQVSRDSKAATQQITAIATADTYVSKPFPNTTLNEEKDIWVKGGITRTSTSYIRFEVKGLGTSPINKATLRLYHLKDPSPSGGKAYRINWDWSYNPTWDKHPGIPANSVPLGQLGEVSRANTYYDMSLSTQGWKDGIVTIVLASDVDDGVNYSSSQGGKPPQLLLSTGTTTGSPTPPSPAPQPQPAPQPAPQPQPQPQPSPSAPGEVSGGLITNLFTKAGWRHKIPSSEPNHAQSSSMASAFVKLGKSAGTENSPLMYIGKTSDPVQTIAGKQFYWPSNANPSSGPDATVEVLNPVTPDGLTNRIARKYTDKIYGGSYTGVADALGDGYPYAGNGTAWGLMSSSAVITPQELSAGVIPHAIGVAIGNNVLSPSKYMAPARRSEGKATGSTIYMGARFQITASMDQINSELERNFSGEDLRLAKIIWTAIHDYGFIARDGTGSNGCWIYIGGGNKSNLPSGQTWSQIFRKPTGLWSTDKWRVPARSQY